MNPKPLFVFPKWSNALTIGLLIALMGGPLYAGVLVAWGLNPTSLGVGYAPVQPVPYYHAIHVGKLGMDCRYCHNTVEKAGFAAIPPTETCMNCHATILNKDPRLAPIEDSYATGQPVRWIQIHDLPDYVYFNHSAHVNVGVSCVECHGQINKMETVHQVEPLNMGWCINCHRDPAPHIRPKDEVTNLDWWTKQDRRELGTELMAKYHVNVNTDCVTCHR